MKNSISVDTLIHARWIVPVIPRNRIFENHSIAIREGKIIEILETTKAGKQYIASQEYFLHHHLLIPGLINSHTHAAMTLLRGLADDLPLMKWLGEHIWPAEKKWVGEEFVSDGIRLAIAEMIRCGTTCYNDMYFFPDKAGKITAEAGIRAVMGLIVIDFPTAWAGNGDEYLQRARQVSDMFADIPLITTALAPHAPYSVSEASLDKTRALAEERQMIIHMHIHETADEVAEAVSRTAMRPLERLGRQGLLNRSLAAVHMTQLEAEEIKKLARAKVNVIHCPESNMKLASGFCPVRDLLDAGVNVALGTDGAASNNDLDMIGEMRTAALIAKGVTGDARALPAFQVLEMATINGAVALGLDKVTGSLEPGKAADITAISFDCPECQPLYNPVSQLVYASSRNMVTDVWVEGKQVLEKQHLTTLHLDSILQQTQVWQKRIY